MKYVKLPGHKYRTGPIEMSRSDYLRLLRKESRDEVLSSVKNNAKKPKSFVLSILITVILFGLLGGAVFFSTQENAYGALYCILGFVLLIVSTIAINGIEQEDGKDARYARPICIAVIILILSIIAMIALNQFKIVTFSTKTVLCLSGAYMGIIGISFIVVSLASYRHLIKVCTDDINATCIGYDDMIVNHRNGEHSYTTVDSAAIYEYYYNGTSYTAYTGNYFSSSVKLPPIGMQVTGKVDPEDPYTCIFENEPKGNGAAIIGGCVFLLFAIILVGVGIYEGKTVYTHPDRIVYDESGRFILTDNYLEKVITGDAGGDAEFLVMERTLIANEDYIFYFKDAGGVENKIKVYADIDTININAVPGDKYLCVYTADGTVFMYDSTRYVYTGTKNIENSDKYDAKGRFIITYGYLYNKLDSYDLVIYDTTVTEVYPDYLKIEDSHGITHNVGISNSNLEYQEIKVGDKFYFIDGPEFCALYNMNTNILQK